MKLLVLRATCAGAIFICSGGVWAQAPSPGAAIDCFSLRQNDNPAMLPLLSFSTRPPTSPVPVSGLASQPLSALDGGQGYTRLRMQFVPCVYVRPKGAPNDQMRRSYLTEDRHWFRRLFAPKTVSKVLTIKTSLPTPNVSTVHTIATVGRDSSRRVGESWSTEVSNTRWLTPYFRVNSETIINVDINLAASTDYKASISADALDLIKRAAGVISPSATLITSLNKDRFNDAASFVDSSINSFFKESVTERSVNDFQINAGNQTLGAIFLNLPTANTTLGETTPVGVWLISTDRVIASVFHPAAADQASLANIVSAASIMNFQVGPAQTLQQALAARSNVTVARDAFIGANADGNIQAAAAALCQAVSNEAEAIGLAPLDVRAVRWAYAETLALQTNHRKALERSCTA